MAMLVITRWYISKNNIKKIHGIKSPFRIHQNPKKKTDGNMFGDLDWPMAGRWWTLLTNKDWLAFNGWGDMDTMYDINYAFFGNMYK